MKKTIIIMLTLVVFIVLGCANEDGKKQKCPKCDNKTQLLVGNKCVDINEIEACGPDGHAHGEKCHCFSGQDVTEINGKKYCLQSSCQEQSDECNGHGKLEDGKCHCKHGYKRPDDKPESCVPAEDIDEHACESKLEDGLKEATGSFNGEHIEIEKKLKIKLLKGKSYVHFPMTKDEEFAVYISEQNLFVDAYSKDGDVKFDKESLGANEDCENDFKEVFHIDAKRQNSSAPKEPVVLEFDSSEAKEIIIFVHPVE